eukprot:TRINITY_DN29535_c0_g1_i3.p1 TRINITY_DN29535_c0_g1~~TRINITY_DN29535_c0_g1_i3.p1  ORF type:complete len:279 (+),score=68.72 TRINITY_DN29535_c0_g1_i3:107-943(+)
MAAPSVGRPPKAGGAGGASLQPKFIKKGGGAGGFAAQQRLEALQRLEARAAKVITGQEAHPEIEGPEKMKAPVMARSASERPASRSSSRPSSRQSMETPNKFQDYTFDLAAERTLREAPSSKPLPPAAPEAATSQGDAKIAAAALKKLSGLMVEMDRKFAETYASLEKSQAEEARAASARGAQIDAACRDFESRRESLEKMLEQARTLRQKAVQEASDVTEELIKESAGSAPEEIRVSMSTEEVSLDVFQGDLAAVESCSGGAQADHQVYPFPTQPQV